MRFLGLKDFTKALPRISNVFHRRCGKVCGKQAFECYKFLKNLDF